MWGGAAADARARPSIRGGGRPPNLPTIQLYKLPPKPLPPAPPTPELRPLPAPSAAPPQIKQQRLAKRHLVTRQSSLQHLVFHPTLPQMVRLNVPEPVAPRRCVALDGPTKPWTTQPVFAFKFGFS